MQEEIYQDIIIQLKINLDLDFDSYQEIPAGINNKLFRINTKQKKVFFCKVYYRDDRERLQREFDAIQFLADKQFQNIPKGYFKNQTLHYALYSYEEGITKTPDHITKSDIETMARFVAKLHSIHADEIKTTFLPAVLACFSLQDYIDNSIVRLDKFIAYSTSPSVHEKIASFTKQIDVQQIILQLLHQSTKTISPETLKKPLTREERRLSPVDFGPHNMLFKKDGSITFVDFEYFGWDDPIRLVADFVNHDQSITLSPENKAHFIHIYKETVALPAFVLNRLDVITNLIAIEWLTIFLQSITPEAIKIRQFANKDFNTDTYIETQLQKFTQRLADLIV